MEAFAGCFSDLADPREDNTRHDLHEILLIALRAAVRRRGLLGYGAVRPVQGGVLATGSEAQAWGSEP